MRKHPRFLYPYARTEGGDMHHYPNRPWDLIQGLMRTCAKVHQEVALQWVRHAHKLVLTYHCWGHARGK